MTFFSAPKAFPPVSSKPSFVQSARRPPRRKVRGRYNHYRGIIMCRQLRNPRRGCWLGRSQAGRCRRGAGANRRAPQYWCARSSSGALRYSRRQSIIDSTPSSDSCIKKRRASVTSGVRSIRPLSESELSHRRVVVSGIPAAKPMADTCRRLCSASATKSSKRMSQAGSENNLGSNRSALFERARRMERAVCAQSASACGRTAIAPLVVSWGVEGTRSSSWVFRASSISRSFL